MLKSLSAFVQSGDEYVWEQTFSADDHIDGVPDDY